MTHTARSPKASPGEASVNPATAVSTLKISIPGIRGKVRAATVQSVLNSIDMRPEESIRILRAWLHDEV